MKNKAVIILLFVLFPLIVGLACTCGLLPIGGNNDEVPEEVIVETVVVATEEEATEEIPEEEIQPTEEIQPVETEEQDIHPGEELVILQETWGVEDGNAFVGLLLKNQYKDRILTDVEYSITLLDAAGQEITQDWNTFPWLFPEQTLGIFFNTSLNDEDPTVDSVDIVYEFANAIEPAGFMNPFSADKVKIWEWEGSTWPIVTGLVYNSDSKTYTDPRAHVLCYDEAGTIIGGGVSYIDFIPGQDNMGFSTFVDTYGTVASVEVFPILSFSSEDYEGSEAFWNSTSVLEDNFQSNDYGTLNGGALIQSNLDDMTLKDAMLAVTFYDADGYVTSQGSQYIDILLPGSTLGVSPYTSTQPKDAEFSTYEIKLFPGDTDETYELTENVFVVNSTELIGDYDDMVKVNFTNTHTQQATDIDAYALVYDANGSIIGGGNSYYDEPVAAGGTSEFEFYVFYNSEDTVDRIETWVVPSYWTEFD